jgi:hypothetical protein
MLEEATRQDTKYGELPKPRSPRYERRKANKKRHRKARARKKKLDVLFRKAIVIYVRETNPCCICGESDPFWLEFHHINPAEKKNEVGKFASGHYTVTMLLREINKCAMVCGDCHDNVHNKPNPPELKRLHITREQVESIVRREVELCRFERGFKKSLEEINELIKQVDALCG